MEAKFSQTRAGSQFARQPKGAIGQRSRFASILPWSKASAERKGLCRDVQEFRECVFTLIKMERELQPRTDIGFFERLMMDAQSQHLISRMREVCRQSAETLARHDPSKVKKALGLHTSSMEGKKDHFVRDIIIAIVAISALRVIEAVTAAAMGIKGTVVALSMILTYVGWRTFLQYLIKKQDAARPGQKSGIPGHEKRVAELFREFTSDSSAAAGSSKDGE